MKVSVVIPVYNAAKTLHKCLSSILEQSHPNFEIILVDNNSTDKSIELVRSFQDDRIKLIGEKRQGRGAARRAGELIATGDIILMTDADCIIPPTWIAELIEPFTHGAIAVQGITVPYKLNYWTHQLQIEKERIVKERIQDKKAGLLDTANFAIRKNVLEHVGFSNPAVWGANDLELEIRMRKKGYDIHYKRVEVQHHHVHTTKQVAKKFFERGRSSEEVRKMYGLPKKDSFISDMQFLGGVGFLFLRGKKRCWYDLVTGFSWRIGILLERLQ